MSAIGLTLAPDAAMVLGIASTAMPFARTREDEAERWLRLLRLHGEVGIALQALGVSEVPLPRGGDHAEADAARPDSVAAVTEHTVRIAAERGVHGVGTSEVLMAVMEVYGEDFDRVLRAHGTDRDEVLERLGAPSGA
ncbi:MAG TPA: hypothetical protein VHT29_00090 [Solirubrobacteraceae bacterium]|jgi:hypothetical protein|nr:hypothetical protein [Solirubrobacteraceae bacterium]